MSTLSVVILCDIDVSVNCGCINATGLEIKQPGLSKVLFILVFADGVSRDSSVGIATRYGLGGLRIESRWGRDFPHTSRLAVGLTQSPGQ